MSIARAHRSIPVLFLAPFLAIAFGLAWGIMALYLFVPEMARTFGKLTGNHPLFFLAVYAPSIAAVIIVAMRTGFQGLRGFFRRLTLWRCGAGWYVFILVIVPLLFIAGAALMGKSPAEWLPAGPAAALPGAMLLMLIKGPLEEPGWRGFALPLLQRKLAPFWAGLVLGIIWGVWHLPVFLLGGTPQSGWSFMPFFAGAVAVSIIITALFNASRGSVLLPALLHFQLINPLWPDAQPYDNALFVAAAAVIAWLHRDAMFDRGAGVTKVVT